jgi:hypothetical protein
MSGRAKKVTDSRKKGDGFIFWPIVPRSTRTGNRRLFRCRLGIEQHLHIAADRACRDVRAGDEKASMNNGKPQ